MSAHQGWQVSWVREEILRAVEPWCETRQRCLRWYFRQSLPAFEGKRPVELVREGRGESLLRYIQRIVRG